MEQTFKYARIDWPKEFIGKWVAFHEFGTHGSYEIALDVNKSSLEIMVFDTKEQAELYMKYFHKGVAHEFMQIHPSESSSGYPYLQIKMSTCGSSLEDLRKWIHDAEVEKVRPIDIINGLDPDNAYNIARASSGDYYEEEQEKKKNLEKEEKS